MFFYEFLFMDTPVVANQQKLRFTSSVESLPRAMADRDR